MVRFVNDDGVEVWHEPGEPRAPTQGLHTGHHRGCRQLIAFSLDDPERQSRIDEVELVHCLLDQLIPVRQDQRAASPPLDEQREDDRFACPRGQDKQGPLHSTRGGGQEGRDRFVLVGARRQAHHGWRGDSSHRVAPPERGIVGHGHTVACAPEFLLQVCPMPGCAATACPIVPIHFAVRKSPIST